MDFNIQQVQQSDRCRPRFHYRQVLDEEKSAEAGTPVFHDVEYVEIFSPGNKQEIPCMPVKDKHRMRWPQEYKAWKEGEEAPLNGFPLSEYPRMTRSMVETLKAIRILTVEDLVACADENLKVVGPMFLNAKYEATEFLKNRGTEQARIEKLEAEKLALEERVSKLEGLISSEKRAISGDDSESQEEPKPKTKAKASKK